MSKKKQDASGNSVTVDIQDVENTDSQNGKGSTFVVTVVNDSIQGLQEWTEEETNLLKQAVEADGGQFNWDVIASSVPSKDINQVKAYVLSMQQSDNQDHQSANVIKAPIEIWTDLAQKLTSEEDKAASVCLPQLMVAASAEPVNAHEAGKPNYGQIYVYLSSLLKGETPACLPPLESSVVLTLIQDIVDKIRTSDVSGQMHYLANWYKQFQREDEAAIAKSHSKKKTPPKSNVSPTAAIKRTSSGRIVRQRVDLVHSCDEEDKEEEEDEKEGNDNPATPSPRPTSLNPFRIPVNLLNFKQSQSTLVVRHAK